jgi:hypothetical protein
MKRDFFLSRTLNEKKIAVGINTGINDGIGRQHVERLDNNKTWYFVDTVITTRTRILIHMRVCAGPTS